MLNQVYLLKGKYNNLKLNVTSQTRKYLELAIFLFSIN